MLYQLPRPFKVISFLIITIQLLSACGGGGGGSTSRNASDLVEIQANQLEVLENSGVWRLELLVENKSILQNLISSIGPEETDEVIAADFQHASISVIDFNSTTNEVNAINCGFTNDENAPDRTTALFSVEGIEDLVNNLSNIPSLEEDTCNNSEIRYFISPRGQFQIEARCDSKVEASVLLTPISDTPQFQQGSFNYVLRTSEGNVTEMNQTTEICAQLSAFRLVIRNAEATFLINLNNLFLSGIFGDQTLSLNLSFQDPIEAPRTYEFVSSEVEGALYLDGGIYSAEDFGGDILSGSITFDSISELAAMGSISIVIEGDTTLSANFSFDIE